MRRRCLTGYKCLKGQIYTKYTLSSSTKKLFRDPIKYKKKHSLFFLLVPSFKKMLFLKQFASPFDLLWG